MKIIPVTVTVMEIEWLEQCLPQFFTYLNKIDDDTMFANEFIKVLLEEQNYSGQIVKKVLVPYLFYSLVCLVYFSYYVPYTQSVNGFFGGPEFDAPVILRLIILIGALFWSGVECLQITVQGSAYFLDMWNFFYWLSNLVALGITTVHGRGDFHLVSHDTLTVISSMEIFMQWLFAFYWMRLFPQLAFYVALTIETLKDITYFLIIFAISISMFGNAFFALNGIPMPEGDDYSEAIWPEAFNSKFVDSVFSQYMLGLGEFNYDGWSEHTGNWIIWVYFILATFFTQILFFNMLIAIMGETYGRVTEAKERAALMERTHLYADWLWAIKLTDKIQGQRYLYVVRPNSSDQQAASALETAQRKIST